MKSQIKLQNDIITKELVEKLKNAEKLEEFNDLMRNGITKGYLTHIIKDESTKGYNELKNTLLDEKVEVPLRFEKIRGIISAVDEKGELLWNDGDRYEGDFKNDKKEGKGIYYWNDGNRYEGDFKNDKKEGKGIYYYNNGNK